VSRIRERAPGVWEVTAAAGRDPRTGRNGQISRTVRATKRAASQAAAELLIEVANRSAGASKGSVGHLLYAFLEHANTRGLAPKTLLGYELLAKQAKADFGSVDLRKLTASRLDSYYRELIRRGLSARTIGHQLWRAGQAALPSTEVPVQYRTAPNLLVGRAPGRLAPVGRLQTG
jgi:hypothetical protein